MFQVTKCIRDVFNQTPLHNTHTHTYTQKERKTLPHTRTQYPKKFLKPTTTFSCNALVL